MTKNSLFVLLAWILSAHLQAQTYTVTDLGTLGGTYSYPNAINNLGQIVGGSETADGQSHATLFSGTGTGNIDLGTLRTGSFQPTKYDNASEATGINDSGVIVGNSYYNANFLYHATIFGGTGANNIDLGTLKDGTASYANGISNSGIIVGYDSYYDGVKFTPITRALRFGTSGNLDLGSLGGGDAKAYGVSPGGQIGGGSYNTNNSFRATLYSGTGTGNTNPDISGGTAIYSAIYGLNDVGQSVGETTRYSTELRAVLFQPGGDIPLGTLGSGTYSHANSINNSGIVVGFSTTNGYQDNHGFIWRDGSMIDLNTLIPPGSGILIDQAIAINDAGQIAVHAIVNNQARAMRLDPFVPPAPAPATYKIVVKASPAAKGTATGGKVYPVGKMVNVIAKPKAGAVFVSWTEKGKIVSRAKIYKFKITKARNLVANFR